MVKHTPSIHLDLGPIPSITNINNSDNSNNNKLQKMHVFGLIALEVHAWHKLHGTGSGQAQEAISHNDGRKSVCWGGVGLLSPLSL